MLRPVIGITMGIDKGYLIKGLPGAEFDLIRREYGQQVKAAGGQPIFLDASTDPRAAARLCDGIVLSGGQDIDPALYDGPPIVGGESIEPAERTRWEHELIDACDTKGIPILGICYGTQLLNLHFGGSLHQNIATEVKGAGDHGNSHHQVMHEVSFEQPFLGFKAGHRHSIASRHHQAVKAVAPSFKVVARAADGVVEAIAGRGHFGVQWHAESDGTAPQIYEGFVAVCSKRRAVLPRAWAKSWQQLRSRTRAAGKRKSLNT